MRSAPTGTVTLLFTDIEGSTRLLDHLGARYASVLAEHRRILRTALGDRGGHEVDAGGDALFATFARARDAVTAAVAAQRALTAHSWPEGAVVRVRIGLHTGEPLHGETGYTGMDVHRAARIGAVAHGGQIVISAVTRELVKGDLPPGITLKDLGTHRLKDLTHPEHLFQVVTADLPAEFPPLRSSDTPPNNLPRQLTSFVGRDHEITEVGQRLTQCSLLTLTGSGGCGKTRLALQVAGGLTGVYRDGIWLAELASVSDPGLVPRTVALALNLLEQPGRSVTTALTDYLQGRHLLLVLDNCEHLLSACAELVQVLLGRCSHLHVLATSREALGVAGEVTFRVPSLALPLLAQHALPEDAIQYEAVRLFVERAVLSQPGFALSSSNASAVARICRLVDGIPLAIELAAARAKVLTVAQIATRLDDRFRLLTGGTRTAVPRHQTLRATMDWSYELLSEPERALLQRLSVFAGGCTLEAAEAVCAGPKVEAESVLDLLAKLVDKSLVLVETQGGEARYRVLETVRQYGRERLEEAGDAAAARAKHLAWYLELAERAEPHLRRRGQREWVARLEAEHDNVRAALAWSRAQGNHEAGLRLVGALFWFWFVVGYWAEGRRWLEDLLADAKAAPASAVAKALRGAAFFAWRQGDASRATTLGERGLALARELGDTETMAWMNFNIGVAAMRELHLDQATTLLEDGLKLARGLEEQWLASLILSQIGLVARRQRQYDRAVAIQLESLALLQDNGDEVMFAYFLRNLGIVELRRGRLTQAAGSFMKSLALCQEVGYRWVAYECLMGLAGVAASQERYARAARLYGAAESLRELIGHIPNSDDQTDHDRRATATRTSMGEAAYEAAYTVGRAMTLEQATEHALREDT